MLGAGVYVSLGEAAATTGGSLVLAVLLGAVVATFNGLSSAELGAYDPRAGGAYQFARELVAPPVGFLAGWLFLLAALAAGGTYALTFASYLGAVLPGVPPRFVGLLLVLAAVALCSLGVRVSRGVNGILVAVNIAILLAFVGLSLPHFQAANFGPFLANGLGGLLQASALLFFAYTGYARPVTVAEEVRDPARTLPRAVPTAIGIAFFLYLGVAFGALGVLGPSALGASGAPLRAAMAAVGSPLGEGLISFGALLASATVMLTEIWGLSRLAFAMSRAGDLPSWLIQLEGAERIPRRAVLVAGLVLVVLVAFLDLRPLLEVSSLALLVYYAIMNLSALRLPRGERLYTPAVPVAGLASCLLVASSLSAGTILAVAVAAAVGMAYYYARTAGRG